MTVIDDVKDELDDDWDTTVVSKPHISDGATKYARVARDLHPFGDGEIIYITNPRTIPNFVDPQREYKDETYEVNIEIAANNAGARDNIFSEAYRIIEVTGVSGYENRNIIEYKTENKHERFMSNLRFTIMKYNVEVAR